MKPAPELAKLHLYVTTRCSEQCPHCWVEAGPRSSRHLAADQVIPQIDRALAMGLREVKVSGGEPLLFQDLTLRIIEHATAAGVTSRLETNCQRLTGEAITRLRQAGTIVGTSLDGASPRCHDGFRGTPGSFQRAVRAVTDLVAAGVQVEVVTCVHTGNQGDLDAVVALCADLGVTALKFNFPSPYGRARQLEAESRLCSTDRILQIARHLEERHECNPCIKVDIDIPRALRNRPPAGPRCDVLRLLSILPDGRFSLCGIGVTHKELTFGTLDRDNIDAVWNGDQVLARMRRSIPVSGQGICASCTEYPLCRGHCVAYSLSEYASLNGPHPLCQDAFELGLFPTERLMVS